MIPQRVLGWLVIAALALPIVISVLVAVGRLLAAMQDAAGAAVLDRLALAGGIVWAVSLIVLVIVLGIQSLGQERLPPEE